jgi:hypothetical protein
VFSKDLIENSSFQAGFEAGFAKAFFFFFLVKFDLVEPWTSSSLIAVVSLIQRLCF